MEIVEDFDEESCNNNGKPRKSSRILRVKPKIFIFFLFSLLFHFIFSIFHCFFHSCFFFIFHFFIFFHFLSCSFAFSCSFSFLSFYSTFFHFLSFYFILFSFVACSKSDFFLGLNFVTISLHISYHKNSIFRPVSAVNHPFETSFPFLFIPFFPPFSFSCILFFFSFQCFFIFVF